MKERVDRLSLWRELLDGIAVNLLIWIVIIAIFLVSFGFIFKIMQAFARV